MPASLHSKPASSRARFKTKVHCLVPARLFEMQAWLHRLPDELEDSSALAFDVLFGSKGGLNPLPLRHARARIEITHTADRQQMSDLAAGERLVLASDRQRSRNRIDMACSNSFMVGAKATTNIEVSLKGAVRRPAGSVSPSILSDKCQSGIHFSGSHKPGNLPVRSRRALSGSPLEVPIISPIGQDRADVEGLRAPKPVAERILGIAFLRSSEGSPSSASEPAKGAKRPKSLTVAQSADFVIFVG